MRLARAAELHRHVPVCGVGDEAGGMRAVWLDRGPVLGGDEVDLVGC